MRIINIEVLKIANKELLKTNKRLVRKLKLNEYFNIRLIKENERLRELITKQKQ